MTYHAIIEVTVIAIEVVAVTILAVGVAWVLGRAGVHRLQRRPWETVFVATRLGLGRVLLLGLEVLIAADIILTVVLELTLANIGALGLLVLVRTFLAWAIEVETEGHWPWHAARQRAEERRLLDGKQEAAAGHREQG